MKRRRTLAMISAVGAVAVAVTLAAAPATAATTAPGNWYYLTNGTTGRATDIVLVGDWNGDSTDTLGLRRATRPAYTIPAVPAGETQWTFAVPGEVKPALYKTTNATIDCVWITADASEQQIGYGFGYGTGQPAYAQVGSDAAYFAEYAECGTWTEALPTDPKKLATSFSDGQYRVGIDIPSGIYQTTVPADSSFCYLSSIADFRGVDATSILANYNGAAGETIQWAVFGSDAGFETDGCGKWTKVADSTAFSTNSFSATPDEAGAGDLRGTVPLQPRPLAELPTIG